MRSDAQPLVSGVPNAIHRGYPTITEAEAAYAYAAARRWTRTSHPGIGITTTDPIPTLPVPSQSPADDNPLHRCEPTDDQWFVVYRGIAPGVYHSLYALLPLFYRAALITPISLSLEALLNTVGISNALYESFYGKEIAVVAYSQAIGRGETGVSPPPAFST